MFNGPDSKVVRSRPVDSARLWALKTFADARLPDERLQSRLIHTATLLVNNPQVSLLQACGSPKDSKGTYRFLSNERVAEEALKQSIYRSTARECESLPCILVPQDTTTLQFNAVDRIQGLGPISDNAHTRGLLLHSAIALREDGAVVGLLHHHIWARDPRDIGCSEDRKRRSLEDKESFKWMQCMQGIRTALDAQFRGRQRPHVIHVQDREGDVFEVLEDIVKQGEGAVIRSSQNRVVLDSQGRKALAHERVRQSPVLMKRTIDVPRKNKQPARKALVEGRAITVQIQAPYRPGRPRAKPLQYTLVEIWEPDPPPGENIERLQWLLWTTEPVLTAQDLWRIVQIYRKRWCIEEVHLTLKSGCRAEQLQLETAERLKKALALLFPIAVRVVQLKTLAHQCPEAPCTQILSPQEWQTLWMKIHEQLPTESTPVPTIRQAVLWIGRLGGHQNRKRDGLPGVRTLWRGWRDLQLLVQGVRLSRHLLRN